jgi:hypothetical protein
LEGTFAQCPVLSYFSGSSTASCHTAPGRFPLKEENRDYGLLEKVFGKERLNELVEQAKQRERLLRNHDYERQKITMNKQYYDEKNGLWYRLQGDYYLSCLALPDGSGQACWRVGVNATFGIFASIGKEFNS